MNMKKRFLKYLASTVTLTTGVILTNSNSPIEAASVYLNDQNMSVALGNNSSGYFVNVSETRSLANIIDAPSADAQDHHNQSTHVWWQGTLELIFDFGSEYDLSQFHFWNYTGEGYDVDNIDFKFFNSANTEIGSLNLNPSIGSGSTAIDYSLNFPKNVQYVSTTLTSTNNQIDFNNIGFTAEPSTAVPEPLSIFGTLLAGGIGVVMKKKGFGKKKVS